jgi:aspartyl-tRNA synthetase
VTRSVSLLDSLASRSLRMYHACAKFCGAQAGRADRQPEFTQLDMELAFAGEAEVAHAVQGVLAEMWAVRPSPPRLCVHLRSANAAGQVVTGVRPATPFRPMTFEEAMRRYGSDKPDVRFANELQDVTPALRGGCGVAVVDRALAAGPDAAVAALRVPAAADMAVVRAACRSDVRALRRGAVMVVLSPTRAACTGVEARCGRHMARPRCKPSDGVGRRRSEPHAQSGRWCAWLV